MYDRLAANDISEEVFQVLCCAQVPIMIRVEVLRLEDDVDGPPRERKRRHTRLISILCLSELVLDLAGVTEVGSIAHTLQDVKRSLFCSCCCSEVLILKLVVKNFAELFRREVLKRERILNSKAPTEAWVYIL